MAGVDPNLPPSFVRQFLEANPSYRPGQNQEVDALFNPSISGTPLHVPLAGQIRKRLSSEIELFWAFDRNGQSPYHERVERLRSVGFEFASTDDVEMAVESTVQGRDPKSNFSNEIRNGDLRLLKIPKRRWLEIRKSQLLQAIMMSNPRYMRDREGQSVMTTGATMPGVTTQLADEPLEQIRARAVLSDESADLRDGDVRGNASVVPQEVVHKEKTISELRSERRK